MLNSNSKSNKKSRCLFRVVICVFYFFLILALLKRDNDTKIFIINANANAKWQQMRFLNRRLMVKDAAETSRSRKTLANLSYSCHYNVAFIALSRPLLNYIAVFSFNFFAVFQNLLFILYTVASGFKI